MAQNFLSCDRGQELLLPPSLREWLPEEHLAWFVLDAVEEMDLAAFYVRRPLLSSTVADERLALSSRGTPPELRGVAAGARGARLALDHIPAAGPLRRLQHLGLVAGEARDAAVDSGIRLDELGLGVGAQLAGSKRLTPDQLVEYSTSRPIHCFTSRSTWSCSGTSGS
jgi:hypothetical protein